MSGFDCSTICDCLYPDLATMFDCKELAFDSWLSFGDGAVLAVVVVFDTTFLPSIKDPETGQFKFPNYDLQQEFKRNANITASS